MDELDKILNTVEAVEINDIVKDVLSKGEFDVREEVQSRFAYTRRVSINDIVPEEYQQKLMQIDITMTQCYWLIGDIASDLVGQVNEVRARECGKVVSKQDIFEAVGFFCHRTGRSVRYYYECAWFFPPEVRQRYDVPFNVYAIARWTDNWELVLRLAEENPIWSAERVKEEYYKATQEQIERRPKSENVEDHGAEVPADEEEVQEGYPASKYKQVILSKLEHTVDDLRTTVDRIPLPTPIRVRIGEVLLEIQDIQMEIRREG